MVERVARAICVSEGRDPDADFMRIPGPMTGSKVWTEYVRRARAAIEAMREPTDEMVGAKNSAEPHYESYFRERYRAAIDEVLK